MHNHIKKLYQSAAKTERRIIGLMSGTSLDGLDVALCRVSGAGLQTKLVLEQHTTLNYQDDYRERVRAVFSKRDVDLQHVTLLNAWIGQQHGEMVKQCLAQWQLTPLDIDLIASHGQTIFHCPQRQHQDPRWGNGTLQIGDADHLSVTTGITTVSDFRQKHIAAGGEGAPLAVYGDYLLFSAADENRIMLNIGGIANLTWLPANLRATEVFSSDIGPGNTLMDAYIRQQQPSVQYDEGAHLAYQGKVSEPLLNALQQAPFFAAAMPKTTGPELFNLGYLYQAQQQSNTLNLAAADVMATLNRFSADTIINAIRHAILPNNCVIYASGGGIHNPLLMQQLADGLPGFRFATTAALTIHPDAKEAVLFALLANECIAGGEQPFADAATGFPSISMGKISFAD
ncbi:anhydro-N-acetylmuramic acid kinase [Rheinheimera sp. UJ51]|uniref:anhydro-N-acetylmuramic acid kinase n=1 Tax=unclassified Rheinheimera TaxID=115860 RepID=UPI001E333E0F|nr:MULTISPECIES: anhydro-N-acetylmuramic acid kinase [unclassified Rheinheimera]MCC5452802.1 anhydro-N-acetylmuramic acid kinase [Rheinheimera sp. UJ51]MCF4010488.1 anhydro-N-acetylmuramic acid kinase [Rheinheimera sp. UJ63]